MEEADPAEVDLDRGGTHEVEADSSASSVPFSHSSSSSSGLSNAADGVHEATSVDEAVSHARATADDEDVGAAADTSSPPRTRNEHVYPNVHIAKAEPVMEHEELVHLGHVHSLLPSVAVIQPIMLNPLSEQQHHEDAAEGTHAHGLPSESVPALPLEEGTVIATAHREAVGRIDEAFGPVTNPLYTVRWHEDDLPTTLSSGAQVYIVKGRATSASLSRLEGVDASGLYDEELPAHEQEHSDDEKEQQQQQQQKNRQKKRRAPARKQAETAEAAPAADAESALRQNKPAAVFEPPAARMMASLAVHGEESSTLAGVGSDGPKATNQQQSGRAGGNASFVQRMKLNVRPVGSSHR